MFYSDSSKKINLWKQIVYLKFRYVKLKALYSEYIMCKSICILNYMIKKISKKMLKLCQQSWKQEVDRKNYSPHKKPFPKIFKQKQKAQFTF